MFLLMFWAADPVSRKALPNMTPPTAEQTPQLPDMSNFVPNEQDLPPLVDDESGPVGLPELPGNPIENFAQALAAEMEKVQSSPHSPHSGPQTVEELRKLAEQIVPSAETIQQELDRLYLPNAQHTEDVVEIIE